MHLLKGLKVESAQKFNTRMESMTYNVKATSKKTGTSFVITDDAGKREFTLAEAQAMIAELGDSKFFEHNIVAV